MRLAYAFALCLGVNDKFGFDTARALVAHHIKNGSKASAGSPKGKKGTKNGQLPDLTSPITTLSMSECPKMSKEYTLSIQSLSLSILTVTVPVDVSFDNTLHRSHSPFQKSGAFPGGVLATSCVAFVSCRAFRCGFVRTGL